MIIQNDLLKKLKDFGINSYEAKLWTALLSRGVSTAGELSDIANVPRSRSYDVLESLEKKGFIIMKLGKPIKYIAVPPNEVIDRIKKKIKDDSESEAEVLETLKENKVIQELSELHTTSMKIVEPADLTGLIKGVNNMHNHIHSMIKNAQKSIILITTEDGIVRKATSLKNAFKKASEDGVDIRIITQINKNSKKAVDSLSQIAKIKHSDDITARMIIVDGQQTFTMMLDDKIHANFDFGIWSSSEFYAKSLQGIFNHIWKSVK